MATPTSLPASFTAGQVLTAAQMNNLRGAFRILQVVSGSTSTQVSTSSATFSDTGLTATITPSSTSSKILVIAAHGTVRKSNGNAGTGMTLKLVRGATNLDSLSFLYTNSALELRVPGQTIVYLDNPATTSATTYKTQFNSNVATAEVSVQFDNAPSNIILCEVSA